MIQHLKIDFPPLVNSQFLLNLGKVNILTGRNSSGKTTILKRILEKPDVGITFQSDEQTKQILRRQMGDYSRPTEDEIDNFLNKSLEMLEGKTLYTSSAKDAADIITEAKKISAISHYGFDREIMSIAEALVLSPLSEDSVLFLSPKRDMPHMTQAIFTGKLDAQSYMALSRLFFLKNQAADTRDKITFENIYKNFVEITGLEFDIQILEKEPATTIQLLFRKTGGNWIVAQDEGLGLMEVLSMIVYSLDGKYQLLLIEEPENHLHPDLQRKLLSFLNSIESRQFILSTHSPVFLNPTMVDRIYFCKNTNREIIIDNDTNRAEALSHIGVLAVDNLTSDAIIITEGKTDQVVIDHIIMKWLDARANASISHVFLAGSMMKYFDATPFAQLRNTFALLDRDTSNSSAQKTFISACITVGILPSQLTRYCLENYYTLDAIKATFGELVPIKVKSLDKATPPWKQLADTNHDENWWKGELKCFRRISSILNKMSIADIEGTDLLEFCMKIKSVL